MSTLTTRSGFDAFRTRMCDQFAQLPDDLGELPLHITQADLAPDTFFTHRVDAGGHHITYDPRQTDGLQARQFLGIYARFTEHPVTDAARSAYYDADSDGVREIWKLILGEIDRTQDPDGVLDEFIDLIAHERTTKAAGR